MGFIIMGVFVLMIIFIKPILLVISILTGDKETLNDVGNLCEDKVPWRDTIWTREELGEPPLPEVPINVNWGDWKNKGVK